MANHRAGHSFSFSSHRVPVAAFTPRTAAAVFWLIPTPTRTCRKRSPGLCGAVQGQ